MFPSGLDNVNLSNGQFFPVYRSFSWYFSVIPGFLTALSKTSFSREKPNPDVEAGHTWPLMP